MADPLERPGPRATLRTKVLAAIWGSRSAEEAADAILALIYQVDEEVEDFDVSNYAELAKGSTSLIRNRWLVARIPLDGEHYEVRRIDQQGGHGG